MRTTHRPIGIFSMPCSDKADLAGVPSAEIDNVWDKVEPFLQRLEPRAHGDWTVGDIYAALKDARMQLWVSVRACKLIGVSITKIKKLPNKTVCLIVGAVGDEIDVWKHHRKEIEPWARDNGCTEMEIIGRRGWIKKLPDYEETYTVLRKKI